MTNLEQLRKMSDEELITFLSNIYRDMGLSPAGEERDTGGEQATLATRARGA